MKTESVAEFLARGGEVQKSNSETTLEELLYNEGLLDKQEAETAKKSLSEALKASLDLEFSEKK